MLHAKAAIAVLLIGTGVLGGGATAFADTAAPVFDHSITARTDHPVVVVRSEPSGQALNDLGYLDRSKAYPSAAEVTGLPSFAGPQWIPIKYDGKTGYVNAADVVVGPPVHVKATQVPTAAAKAPTGGTVPAQAGQVAISANTIWLALAGLLAISAAGIAYFVRRSVVQLSPAGIAAASAIAMPFVRPAGSGLTTAAPTLTVALIAAAAVFIAILRYFDGEKPSKQLLRPAFRDWKVTAPAVAAALIPAIILTALGQSQLVSAAVVMIAAAAVGAWRFALFTNTDRPQATQVEPDVYKPRGFDTSTEGARRG